MRIYLEKQNEVIFLLKKYKHNHESIRTRVSGLAFRHGNHCTKVATANQQLVSGIYASSSSAPAREWAPHGSHYDVQVLVNIMD